MTDITLTNVLIGIAVGCPLGAIIIFAAHRLRCPFVRRSRLRDAETARDGAYRELQRIEKIRAEEEITLNLIASHPHGGLLSNIARVKLERLARR